MFYRCCFSDKKGEKRTNRFIALSIFFTIQKKGHRQNLKSKNMKRTTQEKPHHSIKHEVLALNNGVDDKFVVCYQTFQYYTIHQQFYLHNFSDRVDIFKRTPLEHHVHISYPETKQELLVIVVHRVVM